MLGDYQENEANEVAQYCKKCGQKIIDKSQCKNSILCTECRNKQIKYPVSKKVIVGGTAVCILALALTINKVITFDKYSATSNYSTQVNNDNLSGKVYSDYYIDPSNEIYCRSLENGALIGNLSESFSEGEEKLKENPDNVDIAVTLVKIAMDHGKYEYAGNIINQYIVNKDVTIKEKDDLDKYVDKITAFSNTLSSYTEIKNNLDSNLSDEEKADDELEKITELLNDTTQDKATVYYILGLINVAKDKEAAIDNFNKSIELDNNYVYSNLDLSTTLIRNNELEQAATINSGILLKEKDNAEAERNLAVIDMLKGEMSKAVNEAKKAYDLDKDTADIYETLIIALSENGQIDEANKYISEYESNGNMLPDGVKAVINGQITLKDYYIF